MKESSRRKILLVEDDKFISRAYGDGLKRAGFEVTIATNGKEALEKMSNEPPQLLLLDLVMPIMNGFEVLEEINLSSIFKKIPIIVLSNLGQESDVKKAKELGAVDYLIKSNLSMKQVIEKVKFYIAKSNT
ncbi:response regulator [Patescibacteria group bacterium]|nr:response regulator [Patescibacteria group bacterium]